MISFVVPCYNYGRFLSDCLNSIFEQIGEFSFEIVAVDDASTDDTLSVLERFADRRLRVIRNTVNQGHVKTITRGLREARGHFIARIDPDDRYHPSFLSNTVPILERHPDVGLVYGDAALIDENGRVTAARSDLVHQGRDFKGNEFLALLFQNFICAPTVIARREAWLSALPVPERLAFNDWYFNLMIARRYELYYVDAVLADYRVHGANHHSLIISSGREEPSIRYLLDRIFRESEIDSDLDVAKRRVQNQIYAAQYVTLANKYLWSGMSRDARRCYLKALWFRPRFFLSPTMIRRLLATALRKETYEHIKRQLGYRPA